MPTNDNYQPTLPHLDKQILICGCHNPQADMQYGKNKRVHSYRRGRWNGKETGKLWYCDSCGRPYNDNRIVTKQLDKG